MQMRLVLLLTTWIWSTIGAGIPNDWLLGPVPSAPKVTSGSLYGVPTLTLENGLSSRTFAIIPATKSAPTPLPTPVVPCPPKVNCTIPSCTTGKCCANPGSRLHHGPNPNEVYPYFGMPCSEQSDCAQCTLDKACTCEPVTPGSSDKCCRPNHPPQPQPSNVTGFATIGLARTGFTGREHRGSAQMLRTAVPEGVITLDGVAYTIGGLGGQTDYAFLNLTLLPTMRSAAGAFTYRAPYRTGRPAARFAWTPGARFSDATAAWPPRGLTLEFDFVAPAGAAAAHRGVVITVVYSMYDNLPLYEKHIVVTNTNSGGGDGDGNVVVDALTMDMLDATNEATEYYPAVVDGTITAASTSGRVHMTTEMSRNPTGQAVGVETDGRCTTCTFSHDTRLSSSYPLGPGAHLGPSGFHGRSFASFHTYVLLHDADDRERQGLAVRKMYRTLAPQVTENPVFMHLTDTSAEGVRRAVDQCAEVGFEMIIMSFGSGLNMESKDPKYIRAVAASVAYAHSKNISIGGYNLMSSSRTVAKGGNCLGPDGKPNGASCLASGWADDYFATIKAFIEAVGFDMIETDGPYEGHFCAATDHAHHRGLNDSSWTQYERNMQFYEWCRVRGMYVHAPDPFYFRGINKDGMGYVETNWNLPLWEQITLARQDAYDGTWSKVPSQGWMFVPIDQYHGGWPECCIEPAGFLGGQWEYYLQLYFGLGVSPCYRGKRLYDPAHPAGRDLVRRYTAWNSRYRAILHADLVHLRRAGGDGFDAILHVEPDARKCRERAMLVVFNQNPRAVVNTTYRVPLYYSGLDSTATVSRNGAPPFSVSLARDWSVELHLQLPPASVTWWSFE